MREFVALRPKLYSYKKLDGVEDKNCKGIKKCVITKTLTFEDYKNCLLNDSTEYRSQLMFRSMKHDIFKIVVNKVTFNRDDNKRISKKDGISTLARGNRSLLPYLVRYRLSITLNFSHYIKMPHSNFKERLNISCI